MLMDHDAEQFSDLTAVNKKLLSLNMLNAI